MKNVLLTGARGFIGLHCMEILLEKGFNVHAVSSRGRQINYLKQVEWHHADLHNAEHVLRLMAEIKPEYLLHLAWDVSQGVYWSSLENLRWIKSSLTLFQAFIESGGRRALMAGSCAEYDWSYGYCIEEKTPLKPSTLYGSCKDALRTVYLSAAKESGVSCGWARLFFLYGPHEHPGRLIPSVIISLLKKETVLCTHGEQVRDYLYVKDAARALVSFLESNVEGPVNIASGTPLVLKDLIYYTAEITGNSGLVQLGALAAAKDDPPLLLASTKRLHSEVGWHPGYTLYEGMEETVKWWLKKL